MLFLWLFGVFAGIANACLVPSPSADAGRGLEGVRGHADEHHHGPSEGSGGALVKSNCRDFCDKASISIAAPKSVLDGVLGQALMPPTMAPGLPIVAPPMARPKLPRTDGAWAPPIPIAFLRLTL